MAELRKFCGKHLCTWSNGCAADNPLGGGDIGPQWQVFSIVFPVSSYFPGVFYKSFG